MIAYEGLFALAMGVLAHYQLRPGDKEGHRVTALQGALGVIGLAPQDLALVVWVHEQRNNKIYKMPLDASEAEADDATRLLATALEQAVAVTRK
ncbi:hypothetical protein [Ramlibacter sp.]|uniref:hypothetical protein n=1 Tax=Ramlibacter sp. TaxID=1917967 RepID=UPI003D108E74